MSRRLALLLTHGMGEQQAHELTDTFVQGLTDQLRVHHQVETQLEHRIVAEDETGPPTSHVRVSFPSKTFSDLAGIDVHEVYWADKPQGLIKLKEVGKWLFRSSLAPLRRWGQNAALFYQPDHEQKWWRSVGLFTKEVFTAALLPLLGGLLLLFTVSAVDLIGSYVNDVRGKLNATSWPLAWLAVFALAAAGAVALIAGVFHLLGQVRYERKLTSDDTSKYSGRWKWLRGWALWTGVAAVGLGLVAWWARERAEVSELVRIILRLGDDPALGELAIAALMVVSPVVLGLIAFWFLWKIPWSDSEREPRVLLAVTRVLGALVTTAGVVVGIWWVADNLGEPARIVFWVAGLIAVGVGAGFLVSSIGDVAIYLGGIEETSPHHKTREDILTTTTGRLVDLLEDPSYDEVWVVAHSLGSVISYDAINRVATARRSRVEGLGTATLDDDTFEKLHGFYSFGSPLDKVVYLFFKTTKPQAAVRDQILSSLVSFRRTSSGRPYGPYVFKRYQPRVPEGFRWHNAWSWGDLLGHRIDFFEIDKQVHFDYPPVVAHVLFWGDPDFYRSVLEWMDVETTPPPEISLRTRIRARIWDRIRGRSAR